MEHAPNVPKHVTILGLGPSLAHYLDIVKRQGNRRVLSDEVWGINAVGDVIKCDRIFHMDDVRIQQIRADERPKSNIAQMLKWLKEHSGPIYTSRLHPDYPGLVAFPLEQVINHLGYPYFNNTAAYAVAYAIHIGVKEISLFGIDFTWPDGHEAERGRGCVEYWLGHAHARGIQIYPSGFSSLLDGLVPEADRLYGYDTLNVDIREVAGVIKVEMTPKAELPTAEAIEARYDHDKHPNRIVQAEREKTELEELEQTGC